MFKICNFNLGYKTQAYLAVNLVRSSPPHPLVSSVPPPPSAPTPRTCPVPISISPVSCFPARSTSTATACLKSDVLHLFQQM